MLLLNKLEKLRIKSLKKKKKKNKYIKKIFLLSGNYIII